MVLLPFPFSQSFSVFAYGQTSSYQPIICHHASTHRSRLISTSLSATSDALLSSLVGTLDTSTARKWRTQAVIGSLQLPPPRQLQLKCRVVRTGESPFFLLADRRAKLSPATLPLPFMQFPCVIGGPVESPLCVSLWAFHPGTHVQGPISTMSEQLASAIPQS